MRSRSEVLAGKKGHLHCDSQEVQARTGQGKLQKWKLFHLNPSTFPVKGGLSRIWGTVGGTEIRKLGKAFPSGQASQSLSRLCRATGVAKESGDHFL